MLPVRFVFILLFVLGIQTLLAQIRNPFTEEILPIGKDNLLVQEPGNFNRLNAHYGFIHHRNGKYALPFLTFERDPHKPWLIILNGGPGRSNIRLSFEIDPLLDSYNILLPGYRGMDDRALEVLDKSNDKEILTFVEQNRDDFSTDKVASDLALIAESLQISRALLVAHSYGAIVANVLHDQNPLLIDTIMAFSAVDPSRPMPDPERLHQILNESFVSKGINTTAFEDTLSQWLKQEASDNLILGFVASLYNEKDLQAFLKGVLSGDICRNDVAERGHKYMKKLYLIDFALKIQSIKAPEFDKPDIYERITLLFYEKLVRFIKPNNTNYLDDFSSDDPVKLYIPHYEFFYTSTHRNTETLNCKCGHADLWSKVPQFIDEKLDKDSLIHQKK